MAGGCPRQLRGLLACTHPSGELDPSPEASEKPKAGGAPEGHFHALKQNKGALSKSETGKVLEGHSQRGCVGSLSLAKDVFQEVERLDMSLPSPN